MILKLSKMIRPELERLKENCNFTSEEMEIFDCLSKGKTIREISLRINISEATVNRRIKDIRTKVKGVENYEQGSNLGKINIVDRGSGRI